MLGNVLILLIAALSLGYTGLCLYAFAVSDSIIFPAPAASYEDDLNILKLESSDDESLSAYFLEAPDTKDVLLYSHGNGEDVGHIRPLLREFQKKGISVFTYEYPGYGTSTGKPTEDGVYAAADAAYTYLTEQKGYAPGSITLYGRSLGSGPSCWLAERYPVSGMILEGAFSSTYRVMTKIKLLPFDKFDNIARLPKMKCPVLLMHGKLDRTIPFEHALKNEQALDGRAETYWIDNAGHNNLIEIAGYGYWDAVLRFIRKDQSK